MIKLYYASAIDCCVEECFRQIEEFKKIFEPYCKLTKVVNHCIEKNNSLLQVYGAGFGDNPIIGPDSSDVVKGVVCAFDLRHIRECDILLVVTDLQTFCPGTMMELEYARQMGLYIIVLCLPPKVTIDFGGDTPALMTITTPKVKCKNIFIETYANKVIYSIEELKEILDEVCK